jgi:hypothetical protein
VKTVRWRCLTWNGTVYPWAILRLVRQWAVRRGLCSDPRYRPDKLRAQINNLVLKGAHLLRRIDRGVYIFVAKQPLVGQGLVIEASRSHSDTPHSVGFWTSDQPDADLHLTTHDTHKRQTSILPSEFEPANPPSERLQILPAGFERTNPASERPQTHTLVRTATGTGSWFILTNIMEI